MVWQLCLIPHPSLQIPIQKLFSKIPPPKWTDKFFLSIKLWVKFRCSMSNCLFSTLQDSCLHIDMPTSPTGPCHSNISPPCFLLVNAILHNPASWKITCGTEIQQIIPWCVLSKLRQTQSHQLPCLYNSETNISKVDNYLLLYRYIYVCICF